MTALNAFAVMYTAGLVCLAGIVAQARRRPAGRHRAAGLSTAEQAMRSPSFIAAQEPIPALATVVHEDERDVELTTHIDTLTLPVYGCDPPPGPTPDAYRQLGPTRAMAAMESMRRRSKAIRAAYPTGEHRHLGPKPVVDLQALRVRGSVPTVAEVDDDWYAAAVAS